MMIPDTKPKHFSRRKFCFNSILLSLTIFGFPAFAREEIARSRYLIAKNFDKSAGRVGNWMIKNLGINNSVNLLEENQEFLSILPTLTGGELTQIIADDFTNNRVMNINGILFSAKESVLCIIAANYKG